MTDILEAAAVLQRVERKTLLRLIEAELMRHDMRRFMRWAWPIDPSHSKALIWNWHLDAICEHLHACKSGQIKRLVINVPPRTLKSWTVSVAYPAWVWTTAPETQFLVASADPQVALRDADMLRDMCASESYRSMFRPKWDFRGMSDSRQQDAKGYFRNSAGGHRISKAMGAKSQGANADVIIFDDPLDASDAFSDKAALAAHVVHAKQKFIGRLNDPADACIILIMQRLHELDLSGVFLEEGGYEHLFLPAEYTGEHKTTVLGGYDPRENEGDLLFPERLSAEFLAQKKVDLGSRGYAGQYQQMPAPAAGALVRKEWLQYWTKATLPTMDLCFGSWDCTFGSQTGDADYVVGQTWGLAGDDIYLLDQVRMKMSLPDMLEAIREQDRLWPGLRAVVIERKAAGKDVIATLEREVYGIEAYDPKDRSKEQRLTATLPLWEQGRVYLPHPMHAGDGFSWVSDLYIKELLTFPGARHDDQVDATSQALIWAMENGTADVTIITLGGKKNG